MMESMVDKLSASGINIFHWSWLLGGAASTDVERLPIALHFIFTTSFTMNTVYTLPTLEHNGFSSMLT